MIDRHTVVLAEPPGAVRALFVSSFSALLTFCSCLLAAVGDAAVGLGEAGQRLTVRDRDGAAPSVSSSGTVGTSSRFSFCFSLTLSSPSSAAIRVAALAASFVCRMLVGGELAGTFRTSVLFSFPALLIPSNSSLTADRWSVWCVGDTVVGLCGVGRLLVMVVVGTIDRIRDRASDRLAAGGCAA